MNIDRVVFCVDNNPSYFMFWNNYSYIWKDYFNINPTLFFIGSKRDLDASIDQTAGDVFRLENIEEIADPSPNWLVTWSLFWGASQFPDDTCFLSGIDQVPLSDYYVQQCKNFNSEDYIVFFADAYEGYSLNTLGYWNTSTNLMYPSSHHLSKGKNFKKIYDIEDDWADEANKVFKSRDNFYLNNIYYPQSKLWGLDECYSSWILSLYPEQSKIKYLNEFRRNHVKKRIDLNAYNYKSVISQIRNGDVLEVTFKKNLGIHEHFKEILNSIYPSLN